METLAIAGAVFAALGAVLVAIGVAVARSNRAFERRAARAPGRVVDVRWQLVGARGSGRRPTPFPVLRFTLPGGEEVETVARSSTSLDAMQQGQAVDVLYDPDDPSSARVDGRSGTAGSALLPAAFMAIGGACVLIGLALLAGGVVIDG